MRPSPDRYRRVRNELLRLAVWVSLASEYIRRPYYRRIYMYVVIEHITCHYCCVDNSKDVDVLRQLN